MPGMKKKIGCDREGSDKTRDNMTAARFEYCKPVYICSSLRKKRYEQGGIKCKANRI